MRKKEKVHEQSVFEIDEELVTKDGKCVGGTSGRKILVYSSRYEDL